MSAKWVAVVIAVVTVVSGFALLSGAPRQVEPGPVLGPEAPVHLPVAPTPDLLSPDLGWQSPAPLETLTSTSSNLAGIALSANGSGMVVWQRGGARSELMATRFVPNGGGDGGTNWQVPVQVSNGENGISYSYGHAVAMDAAGDAMATYYAWNETHGYTVYAAHYVVGVGWAPAVAIDQGYDYSLSPVVAMNGAGVAFVVWEVYTGPTYTIFANRYVPGTGWATAQSLETTTNYSYAPDVAVDGAGNAIATWEESDGGTLHIYGARFSTTLGWLAPLNLETGTNYSFYPSVAMDSAGNGVVAWVEFDGVHADLWAKRYDHVTGWAVATQIEPGTYSADYYPGPAVAASNGNASVVWTMTDSLGVAQVYINRYVAGSGWVGPTDIDGVAVASQDGQVAMDPTGNVTVTYQYVPSNPNPPNQQVDQAVRFNHLTSSWSYSQLDYERVSLGSPLLAADGHGNALTAWNYNDNSNSMTPAVEGILTNYYKNGTGWAPVYATQAASWDNQISPSWLQLEANAAGDAIFSFTQNDGPISDGYAVLYKPGVGWGPMTRVENLNSSGVTEEWSAIDGSGNALVLFRASDGTQFNVYAVYYSVATGWGAPQRLDTAAGGNKFWLRVAMNDEGNGAAIWEEYNGTNWNDYVALFTGITHSWSAPQPVQSTFTYLGSAVVGIDDSGDVMAVYNAWNGSGYSNYASYYQPGTGWAPPVHIARNSMSAGEAYALAMNGQGDAAASWVDWNGTRNLAVANVFSPTAGWGTDTVFNSGPGDEGPAAPSLDGAGDALLAYTVWDGTQYNVFAVQKPAGGAWGTPVQLNSGSGDASQLVTALNYEGDGFAAWSQFNGYGYDIEARRYVAGEGWMAVATVNQPAPATPTTDSGSPNLGVDGHGNAVLGWNEWEDGALLPFGATYVVGNGLPSLTLTSPTDGTLTNRSGVTVAGTTDPGAAVTIDGAPVPVAANGSFTQSYTLADGTHTFAVVATNGAGLSSSVSTTVTVDTTAPLVLISTPLPGSLTNDPTAQVIGSTEPGASVVVDGVAAAVSAGGDFSVAIPLQEGVNTIRAVATDPAGNTASASVTVTLDTIPPPLTLTSPAAGYTNRSAVVVSGSTEAGATVTVDGAPVSVGGSGAFTTTLTLTDGSHTLVVVATDGAGNQATTSVAVIVDSTPESVAITSPVTGSSVSTPSIVVTGTAEIGSTLVVNGYPVALGTGGAFSVELPLAEGLNTITATATDPAGNTASASVTVTLDTVPPPLNLSSPTAGYANRSDVAVSGSTEPGATVTVDGTPVTVTGAGTFTTTLTLSDGTHTIVAVATDAAGNTATVSVQVTVDTAPETLAITSPTTGATVSTSDVVVTGTAEVGSTVVVNGYAVALSSAGTFSIELPLTPGLNTITATATDPAGNQATKTVQVTYNDPVPGAQASINSLNTTSLILIGLVGVALALGIFQALRGRKPKVGSAAPWKETGPEKPSP
jgi:Glucodextranase, domain B